MDEETQGDAHPSIASEETRHGAEIMALIDVWFTANFVSSRANTPTELWNAAQAAKQDLTQRLLAYLEK